MAALVIPTLAWATPKPLPFTYGVDTNPKGQGEVEQYVDLVPVVGVNINNGNQKTLAIELLTEVEYGITNNVELGLYVTLAPSTPGLEVPSLIENNGSKQRIRWRLADQGAWPIDVALYGEIVESTVELELEAKVILEKRFGKLRLLANAWAEHEFYFNGTSEWVLNPTAGFTFQVTPNVAPGVEYWMRAEFGGATSFNAGPHHYLGPTMRIVLGNFFWTTGFYMRVSNIGYQLTPGVDAYGPVWFRSIVGYGFQ